MTMAAFAMRKLLGLKMRKGHSRRSTDSASTLVTTYDKLIEEFVQQPSDSAYREFEQVAFPVHCLKDFDEFDDYIEFTSPTRKLLQESQDIPCLYVFQKV